MLIIDSLSKTYGKRPAVRDLSFSVPNGQVTGFLGPNGAGKSTTMRMILGLEAADAGTATFDGESLRRHARPAQVAGALLDATWFHPGRSAWNHIKAMADLQGVPDKRVAQVLEQVGIADAAHKRVGSFSLGMRQRFGLACALLSDPDHVLLDEPVNGLDPAGVQWMRGLIDSLAQEGKAVLVSSHLLGEMQAVADRLVVIGKGALIHEGTLDEFLAGAGHEGVEAEVSDPEALVAALLQRGIAARREQERVVVDGAISPRDVGTLCSQLGIAVFNLTRREHSLEEAFFQATGESVEFVAK